MKKNCKSKPCFRCGSLRHNKEDCEMRGPRCRNCSKIGHEFAQCYFLNQDIKSLNKNVLNFVDDSKNEITCSVCHKKGHLVCSDLTRKGKMSLLESMDTDGLFDSRYLTKVKEVMKKDWKNHQFWEENKELLEKNEDV